MSSMSLPSLFPPALSVPIAFDDINEGDTLYVTVSAPQYQSTVVGVAHRFDDGACEDAGGRILATASYAREEDETVVIFRIQAAERGSDEDETREPRTEAAPPELFVPELDLLERDTIFDVRGDFPGPREVSRMKRTWYKTWQWFTPSGDAQQVLNTQIHSFLPTPGAERIVIDPSARRPAGTS